MTLNPVMDEILSDLKNGFNAQLKGLIWYNSSVLRSYKSLRIALRLYKDLFAGIYRG